MSMGIAAPVTKEAAGKQYHVQLAREVPFSRLPPTSACHFAHPAPPQPLAHVRAQVPSARYLSA